MSSSLDANCSGKMEPLQRAALTLSLVLLCSMCAHGAVRMPKFFSNGLVLQTNSQSGTHNFPLIERALGACFASIDPRTDAHKARSFLSGWADVNETVTVTAPRGPYTAIAGPDGAWSIQLDPVQANPESAGPYTISVVGAKQDEQVIAHDVYFGEVLLCAGGAVMSPQVASDPLPPLPHTLRLYIVGASSVNNSIGPGIRPDVPANSSNSWARSDVDVAAFAAAPRTCVLSAIELARTYPPASRRTIGIIVATTSENDDLAAWLPPDAKMMCGGPPLAGRAGSRYAAMIAPFQMTSVRAVLWALDPPRISKTTTPAFGAASTNITACYFRAMINAWRDAMPAGDFAFLFAQSAVMDDDPNGLLATSTAVAQSCAIPRPSTLLTRNETHAVLFDDGIDVDTTGMVVTADIPTHNAPARAAIIAQRFALLMAHVAYAEQPASAYTGPVLVDASWNTTSVKARASTHSLALRFSAPFASSGSPAGPSDATLRLISVAGCTTCCMGSRPVDIRVCSGVEPDDLDKCSVASTVGLSDDDTALVAEFDTSPEDLGSIALLMSTPSAQCGVAYATGSNVSAGVSAVFIRNASAPAFRRRSAGMQSWSPSSPRVLAATTSGLFGTPAMGWNAWNAFHCDVSERLVMEMADALVDSGLAKAGYRYVNLDDCWMVQRASDGTITPDPSRFPSGIKRLADYVHSKGLLFGVYQAPATTTPQGRPGLYGHEAQDVATFCEWGVDYLKLDSKGSTNASWHLVREAINHCKRPMWLQVAFCKTVAECEGWMDTLANSWRTSGDAQATWASLMSNTQVTEALWPLAGPTGPIGGHWNDADLLEVGNVGLTPLEMKTQVSLWSFMSCPLLSSFDLRKLLLPQMSSVRDMLTNPGIISLSQDPLGYADRRVLNDSNRLHVYSGIRVDDNGTHRWGLDDRKYTVDSVVVAECDGGEAQQFVLNVSEGTIMHVSSGAVLTVPNCATSDPSRHGAGVPVVFAPLGGGGGSVCGGLNQRWTMHTNGTITSRMTSSSASQCLDVYAHINPVQLHFCVPNPSGASGPPESEAWQARSDGLHSNSNGTWTIRWGMPGFSKCLQNSGGPAPPTPPTPPPPTSGGEVWEKQLSGGDVALLLINWGDAAVANVTVDFGTIPGLHLGAAVRVHNVWSGADEGIATASLWRAVQPHDAVVLRVTPTSQAR